MLYVTKFYAHLEIKQTELFEEYVHVWYAWCILNKVCLSSFILCFYYETELNSSTLD